MGTYFNRVINLIWTLHKLLIILKFRILSLPEMKYLPLFVAIILNEYSLGNTQLNNKTIIYKIIIDEKNLIFILNLQSSQSMFNTFFNCTFHIPISTRVTIRLYGYHRVTTSDVISHIYGYNIPTTDPSFSYSSFY